MADRRVDYPGPLDRAGAVLGLAVFIFVFVTELGRIGARKAREAIG